MNKTDIEKFSNDFIPILKFLRRLYEGFRDPFLDKQNYELANNCCSLLSKKYKGITISLERYPYKSPKPKILLDADLPEAISYLEKLIPKIDNVSIAINGRYTAIDISDAKAKYKELEKQMKANPIKIRFTPGKSKREIILSYSKEERKTEITETEYMQNREDPEFLICAYFALKAGYDAKIDLSKCGVHAGRTASKPQNFGGLQSWRN